MGMAKKKGGGGGGGGSCTVGIVYRQGQSGDGVASGAGFWESEAAPLLPTHILDVPDS